MLGGSASLSIRYISAFPSAVHIVLGKWRQFGLSVHNRLYNAEVSSPLNKTQRGGGGC